MVEAVGDDEPEHRVPQELQALVGGQAAVLVGVRAVRQRLQEQRRADAQAETLLQAGEVAPTRPEVPGVAADQLRGP
ncbi:hypothetical protein GCM10023225_24900 [Kineococcus glutinatus]|uniref:Uncharacterized protein n=1 Tax=Kineococcus glutinatus TaxID=1070872 RepID=A0ABP9I298_9ACTN